MEDRYRYAGRRNAGNETCMIQLIPGNEDKPTGLFRAYPDWHNLIYTLYPADKITYRLYKKHTVSMDLVREYK